MNEAAIWKQLGLSKPPAQADLVVQSEVIGAEADLWQRITAFIASGGAGWLSTTHRVYHLEPGISLTAIKQHKVLAGELARGPESLHIVWQDGWRCTTLAETAGAEYRVQVVTQRAVDPELGATRPGGHRQYSGTVTYHVYWPVKPSLGDGTVCPPVQPKAARFVELDVSKGVSSDA